MAGQKTGIVPYGVAYASTLGADHHDLCGIVKNERQWASERRVLPDYVQREFDEYLKCGRLERGFLRVQCETCHAEHIERGEDVAAAAN